MKSISKIGVTIPENNCAPINLEITEVNGPGTTAYLDVEGILPTDALWDTWEWQINLDWVFNADNANWVTSQTGGLLFNVGADEASVRIKFTKGSCIYYSNVSGMYDHPSNKYYAKANIDDITITGTGTLNISNVINLGNGFNIDPTTDRITNVTGAQKYVKVTLSLGFRVDLDFLLSVYKNGVLVPNFSILDHSATSTTASFSDIVIMDNNDYLTFVYDVSMPSDGIYGNIIVETIDSYINYL
jgi:hypothetical protein